MDPMTMSLIYGGIGLGKSVLFDRPQEMRDRQLRATQIAMSPWIQTPLQEVRESKPLDTMLQGGMQGYEQGQKIQDKNDAKAFQNRYLDILSRKPAVPMVAPSIPSIQGGSQYFGNSAPTSPVGSAWTLF